MRVLLVGAGVGAVFAILDALLNANPLAAASLRGLQADGAGFGQCPARARVRPGRGCGDGLAFRACGAALPGGPVLKGVAFGSIAWFFRVAMGAASQAVMFNVPGLMLGYMLLSGLVEMTVLGALDGLALAVR